MQISALWGGLFRNKIVKDDTFVEAVITRVVDGDTVVATINNESKRVRLIGVDTPETVHPKKGVEFYGREASNFSKRQLTGKRVYLEYDKNHTDRYNRTLVYVWLEKPYKIDDKAIAEKMFNAILIRQGFGKVVIIRPNNKYENTFRKLEASAKANYLGMWQQETFMFKVTNWFEKILRFFSAFKKTLKFAHIL